MLQFAKETIRMEYFNAYEDLSVSKINLHDTLKASSIVSLFFIKHVYCIAIFYNKGSRDNAA